MGTETKTERLIKAAISRLSKAKKGAATAEFARVFYGQSVPDELAEYSAPELAAVAASAVVPIISRVVRRKGEEDKKEPQAKLQRQAEKDTLVERPMDRQQARRRNGLPGWVVSGLFGRPFGLFLLFGHTRFVVKAPLLDLGKKSFFGQFFL